MSEEPNADDGFDYRIRRSMAGLGAGAAEVARPSTGADIRRRATRRRNVLAAGTLSVALVVGGGAVIASDVLDRPGAGTLVVPGHSASPTTPTSTPEPTESLTALPPSVPTTTDPPTSTPPPVDAPPTEIPAGFTLPHEGEVSDESDYSDWETVDELATPWDMTICNVEMFEGDEARTDFRRVSQTGPEWYDSYALAVYADADVAVGVMADLRGAIEGCVDETSIEGQSISWDLREVAVGGEAFVAVSSVADAEGNPVIGGVHFAVTRLGTAIFLTLAGGESFPTVDDEQSAHLVARLQDFAPTLCVFTVAGC